MRIDLFKNSLLLILIASSLLLFLSSCKNKKVAVDAHKHEKEVWTCSMHPEIIRNKPGTCPICGMDLVKKEENAKPIQNIALNDLLQPTDRFVVSAIPVITMTAKSDQLEIEVFGTVAYDPRFENTISARVTGRIEKLYVRYRFQHIMKGQRIMDIYSPELLTTEQELLFLIKNDAVNTSLINAAKQKLLLLGVSEGQLQQIIQSRKPALSIAVYSNYSGHIHEANTQPNGMNQQQSMEGSTVTKELSVKEGMYLQSGQSVFKILNVERSWALLNIFSEYQGLVKTGDAVKIVAETMSGNPFRGRIDFIEPFFRKENKTLTARVYFNNATLQIPIGSQLRATIFIKSIQADWLPENAVLSLGIDKVVFLKTPGGFKAHKIETGLTYKNQVQVLSGLHAIDLVASNAQFLTDSESFIKINEGL